MFLPRTLLTRPTVFFDTDDPPSDPPNDKKDPESNGKDDGKKGEETDYVPYDRFKEVNEARKKSEEKLEKLTETIDRLKGALTEKEEEESDKIAELVKAQEELERRLNQTEREKLLLEVAQKYNLPSKLTGRLQGETREELEADAKELAEFISEDKKKGPPPPPGPTDEDDVLEDVRNMDPEEIRKANREGRLI